ncbi:T-complex protein 1 subunit beta [Eumeta japonica]|uniref:T-complex protein 1 subunit beta n=1 Tax=Eumeta variegata TaxID=151549 RepID=A0A4C1YRD8_EUMVA|nr:T-complex protein 1 subunit beta [Eumeta japonica]
MVSLNPIRILKNEAEEEKAEVARMSSFIGAIAIGDLVKSTLGPKGMDKILVSAGRNAGQVEVTNDGATILKSIGVDNPAAKILVDMSKVQDDEVGDGTTSVTVLAAELLREAEKLIEQKLHPQIVIAGWRIAVEAAKQALADVSFDHEKNLNEAALRADLENIARTTLSSKILANHKEHFTKLAVDAVLRLKGSGNLKAIQIIKISGGILEESFLDEGFLLNKKIGVHQPKRMENCNILIANTPMDTDKIKVFGSTIKVDSMAKIAELEVAEKEKMKDKVNKILAHKCNVFINRQLIYNYPEQLFADAGVMAIEHADFEGIERLALVMGGEIVSTFDTPSKVKLGHCKVIEEMLIGDESLIRFSGVALGSACTVVVRGATQQIIDEAERSLHDALCVLTATVKEPKVVCGGGMIQKQGHWVPYELKLRDVKRCFLTCKLLLQRQKRKGFLHRIVTGDEKRIHYDNLKCRKLWGSSEMLMAEAVSRAASRTPGKEALATEAFATALRRLPAAVADNAGYDSAELVARLRAHHAQGENTMGLDMENGRVGDMKKLGVTESYVVKRQMLVSAAEAAEMILRVDNILKSAPRRRGPDRRPC